MKLLYIFIFTLYASASFSQVKTKNTNQLSCCTYNTDQNSVIPKLEDLKCKNDITKNNIYSIFPQIINYKDFDFLNIIYCNDESPHAALGFIYYNSQSQEDIKISITDFNDSYFETIVGVHLKDILLWPFTAEAKELGHCKTEKINNFDRNIVMSSGFYRNGEKSPYACFNGYYKNRYLIEILIKCKNNRFNKPKKVEEFVIDYLNQMNF